MAGYLSCITVGGGVPLFTRRAGDLKAVSYSGASLIQIPIYILISLEYI